MRNPIRWGVPVAAVCAAVAVAAGRSQQSAKPTMATASVAATSTTVLAVSGMTCGACVPTVGDALKTVEGVGDITASVDTGEVTIRYDAARTNPEALAKALTDYKGAEDFTATVKPAKSPKSS